MIIEIIALVLICGFIAIGIATMVFFAVKILAPDDDDMSDFP